MKYRVSIKMSFEESREIEAENGRAAIETASDYVEKNFGHKWGHIQIKIENPLLIHGENKE